MRCRPLLLVLAILPVGAFAQGRTHMTIEVNGSAVGENTFEKSADGAITSKSTLDLGSVKISSTVTAHMRDGKLVDATAVTDGPQGKSTIALANGKIQANVAGKDHNAPFADTTGALAGNLHPQFFAGSLAIAQKAILANPASRTTTVDAYFVDAGGVLPLKITAEQAKSVEVGGKHVSARRFTVEVTGIRMDIVLDPEGNVATEDVPSQHLRMIEDGWEKTFSDPMAKFPELSQATYKTLTEKGVHMKTRDGVDLVCDIVRPDDSERHPAILVRTPYGRGAETTGGEFYASRGYAYVTQDCRGREDSDGIWDPFVNEGKDGYDTIQWVAKRPWCNGKVGMIGGSYSGYVQWAAAVLQPPALKCIVPQVSPPDAMHNIPYDHGVFALYPDIWWAKIVAGKHTDFSSLKGILPEASKLTVLPLGKVDEAVLGEHLDFFDKWLSRPGIGDWKGFDYTYHLANVKIPALYVSGTWDGDEIGTHIDWQTMRALKRTNQWIVFGPWVHAFDTTHSFGDVEYGPDAIIDLDSVYLRWFDTWLKDKQVKQDKVPHVKLFVTGANKWINLPDWPAPSTPARTMYFAKDGLKSIPGKPQTATYTYDPAEDSKKAKKLGPNTEAQADTKLTAEQLKGVLYLKTAPLTKDTAIATPVAVNLHFKSSAEDTDFFAMVVDVAPNGEARLVGLPGKIRCSYLKGMDKMRPLTPGRQYTASLVPWDFAHEFKKGHRIGLVISSSMFPGFARNLGTVQPIKTATKMVVQKNTILMGKGQASSVTFHVLWEK